ncbi:MAG: hypothetical protein FWD24_07175 [Treponema sp.]|nr:hypothetical protein [Treponema sp.]
MVEKINTVSYRTRISPEYAYYVDYTWYHQRSNAARALAAKLNERSSFVFMGDPDWRYRQNIARLDSEIEVLRANLQEIEDNAPLINNEPEFSLTSANLNFTFPAAPAAGTEFRFCTEQKADAFLSGSIIEFHGRYFFTVKLYTVYTRSFVWEDDIIFSLNDIDNALDEITRRLLLTLSGNTPAALAIKTEPDDTLVLINRTFAGRGENTTLEYPPGTITISASSEHHESLTFETEIFEGEIVEISINLKPVDYVDVEIFSNYEGSIYNGALYIGETPLTLRLPVNQMVYLEFETPDNLKSEIIFQTPNVSNIPQSLSLRATIPLQEGQVERDRNWFYWVYGGMWISGITAWIAYHNFFSADTAIRLDNSQRGRHNDDFYGQYINSMNFYTGTLVAAGVVSAYGIYRLVRYLHTANRTSTPVIRSGGR